MQLLAQPDTRWSAKPFVRRGLLVLFFGAGGLLAWALGTEIHGAVISTGRVEVDARRQIIQHAEGGVVDQIAVRDGDRVAEGDTILVLDSSELRQERALTEAQLFVLAARRARLEAETIGAQVLVYPPDLRRRAEQMPDLAKALEEGQQLFVARLALYERSLAQIGKRKLQSAAALAGQRRQLASATAQRDLVRQDLAAQEKLLASGLTQTTRVTALRRELAQTEGRIGELEAAMAETQSELSGLEIEAMRMEVERRTAAEEERSSLLAEEAPLLSRLDILDTRLDRTRLVAPMAGKVLGLTVFTVGGVVAPGAEIASIVPEEHDFFLSIQIDPARIDQVAPGAAVRVRFPAFNQNLTPEVEGQIRTIGADALVDPQTGIRYYPAEVSLSSEMIEKLGEVQIIPGMPVEAYVQTGARTPASWLMKPIMDQLHSAMREE
jgi:HlyD family type I secretion membrane fusion protein